MYSYVKLSAIYVIIILAAVIANCTKKETPTISISGSTTIEPYIQRIVAVYKKNNDVIFNISAKGSTCGLDSLGAGTCDIAMSSTEISPDKLALAKKRGVSIKSFLLGYDIISPIVHPQNRVQSVTFKEMQDIFTGKITNWSAVEGADSPIDVINRNTYSGTFQVWNRIVHTNDTQDQATATETSSNSSILAYVSEHEHAIGYISSVYINPEVKPLLIDSIPLDDRERLIEQYPIKRPLYLYVNETKFTDEIKKFVIHIIMNERAKKIFGEMGFIRKDHGQDIPQLSD